MAEKILNKISFGESAVDVYLITDSAARAHMADSAMHVTAAEKSSWNGKQDAITSSSKLDYSLIDNAPSIPTVNNAVVTISQGGVSKGSFNVNAASNVSIDLDAGGGAGEANIIEAITFNGTSATVTNKVAAITASIPTVNSPKITINQGGASKGSFNLNQPGSSTINLDAPGESNVIEAVQLNGTNLSISNKSVNVQAITGITVNGTAATVANGVAAITVTGGGCGEGGITLAQARRQALIFG